MHPVCDGPVIEQGGEDFVHRLEHVLLTANIQEGLLLSCKRGLRQILRGGGGAHRNRDVPPVAHSAQLVGDRLLEGRREWGGHHPAADLRPGLCERGDVIHVQRGQLGADALIEATLLEKFPIGLGGGGKSAWNAHSKVRKRADHLPERCVLATDGFDIVHAETLERNDIRVQEGSWLTVSGPCACSPAWAVKHSHSLPQTRS